MLRAGRAIWVATFVAIVTLLTASNADAAAVRAALRAGDTLDGPAFHLLIPAAASLEIRIAVGADVDADGDVDVVASTDRGLVVWINDGSGHFRRRNTRRHPIVDGPAAPDRWSGDAARSAETVQSGTFLVPLIVVCAHAPPSPPAHRLAADRHRAAFDRSASTRVPRAPPAPLV